MKGIAIYLALLLTACSYARDGEIVKLKMEVKCTYLDKGVLFTTSDPMAISELEKMCSDAYAGAGPAPWPDTMVGRKAFICIISDPKGEVRRFGLEFTTTQTDPRGFSYRTQFEYGRLYYGKGNPPKAATLAFLDEFYEKVRELERKNLGRFDPLK